MAQLHDEFFQEVGVSDLPSDDRCGSCFVGHGRMGTAGRELAPSTAARSSGRVSIRSTATRSSAWPQADVAIDFSIASAVPDNVASSGRAGISVVIGTTGWADRRPSVRAAAEAAGIGVVAAPNFSLGVNLFLALTRTRRGAVGAARGVRRLDPRGASRGQEGCAVRHGAQPRSGDEKARVHSADRCIVHAGGIHPGHTHRRLRCGVGNDHADAHRARSRPRFARGALQAAQWVKGRQGWFTMRDVLGI